MPGSYDLEVSSPGIDRPVQRLVDFQRFVGFRARVVLEEGLPRRRYTGRLSGVEGDVVKELETPVVARGRFKGVDANERDYRIKAREKGFAAGDIRRGQSLVVWAINEGRGAARECDRYLMGYSDLP